MHSLQATNRGLFRLYVKQCHGHKWSMSQNQHGTTVPYHVYAVYSLCNPGKNTYSTEEFLENQSESPYGSNVQDVPVNLELGRPKPLFLLDLIDGGANN